MNEVEEIKNRLDIVELIGSYIPLKKAGSNFKGLSPFKNEKTPSFMVSPEKNIWHDFSSGQGGDIFSFIMQIEGIDFREALELLAKKAGITLSRTKKEFNKKSNARLYDAVEQAMKFYHLNLSKNKTALEYFTKTRKISTDTIKKFKLGYSPDDWTKTYTFLTKLGFIDTELVQAGLIKQKSNSQSYYDVFRNRLMFPIFDSQNRAVGFSARSLIDSKTSAKYVNTAETVIYHKSSILYGLSQAKPAIRQQSEVIIVEGNMDVVALSNHGYENVVAASGTALSDEQLKILSRLTKNIKLCFDQDQAGLLATERAIDLAQDLDTKLSVIVFKNAKDPDELIKKDKPSWDKAVKNSIYAFDYLFGKALEENNVSTAVGKKQFVQKILPIIANLHDDIEQQHYIKKMAQQIDTPESIIRNRISKLKSKKSNVNYIETTPVDTKKTKRKLTKAEKIEQLILELMLSREVSREGLADIEISKMSPLHKPIFEYLKNHPSSKAAEIAKNLPKYSNYVNILSLRGEHVYSDSTEHDARLEAFTQIHRLNKIEREKTKRQLSNSIAIAEAQKDDKKVQKLLKQYQALLNEE